MIQLDGDRVEFAHPLLATVTYESLLPDERQRLHERLAAASQGLIERGHHLSLSRTGQDKDAVAALDAAAGEAARLGTTPGRLASCCAPPSCRSIAAASARRGRRQSSRRPVTSRRPPRWPATWSCGCPGGVQRAKARQTLVSCLLGSSLSYDAAQRQLALALVDARGDPVAAATLRVELGSMATARCRLDEALEHLRIAERLADEAGADQILARRPIGAGLRRVHARARVSESALSGFHMWDGTVLWPDSYTPRMALACARLHATEFDQAETLFVQELRFAEAHGLEASRSPHAAISSNVSSVPAAGRRRWLTAGSQSSTPARPRTPRS